VNPYRIAGVPPSTSNVTPLREEGHVAVLFCERKNGGGWTATTRHSGAERELVSLEGMRWFTARNGLVVDGVEEQLLRDEVDFQRALRSVGRGRQR
jgi:hypothetical protein